jgi:hypothetical protein
MILKESTSVPQKMKTMNEKKNITYTETIELFGNLIKKEK